MIKRQAKKQIQCKKLKSWLKDNQYTQRDLAHYLNITPGAVWIMIHQNGIPPRRAQDISEFTGYELSLHDLCPKIFPSEKKVKKFYE